MATKQNSFLNLSALLVFFLGMFVIFLLYAGLPYDFSMDLVIHENALQKMSFKDLAKLTLNPLTPAWFYMTEIGYLRPIYYLFVKFFFNFFGAVLFPVHIAVALGCGLFTAVSYRWIERITSRRWIAFLLILLYLSFPTNAIMLAGYLSLDLQFFHSVLTLGLIAIFSKLTWEVNASKTKQALWLAGWVLLTWITIKWKSSEKLFPCIYFAFLVLFAGKTMRRIGKRKFVILIFLNLCMFLLVVPVKRFQVTTDDYQQRADANFINTFTKKDVRMFSAGPANLWARTFVMPGAKNPLTHPLLDDPPTSFTGSFGFLLGWLFWLGLPASLFLLRERKARSSPAQKEDALEGRMRHDFFIFTVWFLITVAAFSSGAPLEEVRYLNFAFVPAIFILAFIYYFIEKIMRTEIQKKILLILFSASVLIPVVMNTQHLLKWTGHYGGIQHALFEAETDIFKNHYGKPPDNPLEVYVRHQDLEREAVLVSWYDLPDNWLELSAEKIRSHGSLFVKVRTADDPRLKEIEKAGYTVSLVGTYPFSDAKPLLFGFYRTLMDLGLKRVKKREILLYRVSENKVF